jgi:hypothetical protein
LKKSSVVGTLITQRNKTDKKEAESFQKVDTAEQASTSSSSSIDIS